MNSNKIDHKNLLFFFPPIIEDDYYKYSQKQNTPLYIYSYTPGCAFFNFQGGLLFTLGQNNF